MKLFLSYAAGHPMTFETFCGFAHQRGFEGVEFIPDLSPNLPEEISLERIVKLMDLKAELGLEFTVHNIFYDINMTSLVPRVRALAFELTEDVLRFAASVEASAVIVHTGYRFGAWRSKPKQMEMFDRICTDTHEWLSLKSNEFNVPILLENGNYYLSARNSVKHPLHIGITAADLIELVTIPREPLDVCFDVGKAYFSVDDWSVDQVLEYLEAVRPYLKEIHMNAFDGYEECCPPVLERLKEIGFDGPLVFECGQSSIDLLLEMVNSI